MSTIKVMQVKFFELSKSENGKWSCNNDSRSYIERVFAAEQLHLSSVKSFFGDDDLKVTVDNEGHSVLTESVIRQYIKDTMTDFSVQNFKELYLSDYNYSMTPPTINLYVKGESINRVSSNGGAHSTIKKPKMSKEDAKEEERKNSKEDKEIRAKRINYVHKYWGRDPITYKFTTERASGEKKTEEEEGGAKAAPFLLGMYETVGRVLAFMEERGVASTPTEVYRTITV